MAGSGNSLPDIINNHWEIYSLNLYRLLNPTCILTKYSHVISMLQTEAGSYPYGGCTGNSFTG